MTGVANQSIPQPTLLTTKLALPPVRPVLLYRPRLHTQLQAGLHAKLTLLTAPPGFGKTTLVVDWLHQAQPTAAWVSLDAADNDPTRFWLYVIAALQTIYPDVGAAALTLLQALQPPANETVVTALINGLAEQSTIPATDCILVLDDYHLITTGAIHAAVAFFLDHLPAHLHLVLTSRSAPPLPLARLRAYGQLVEVQAADLRFTRDEATAFFAQVMGVTLAPEDVAALDQHTEGWITALHLAALAMRGHANMAEVVAGFTGNHRYIVDYLTAEVLQRQPVPVQHFLLTTSILNRLCGPLCDAIIDETYSAEGKSVTPPALGSSHQSQDALEQLERANLFLVPLDDQRVWYRYHHVFVDFLRARLHQEQPEQVPRLHRRAATWYAARDLLPEAIDHALAGVDFEQAAHLIAQVARPMLMRSETATVLRWLEHLPETLVCSQANLGIIAAWVLVATGHMEQGEVRLQQAEQCLQTNAHLLAQSEKTRLEAEMMAIRSVIAGIYRDIPRTISTARQAIERLPEDMVYLRGLVALMLGGAYHVSGNVAEAGRMLTEAQTLSRSVGNIFAVALATRQLAELQILQGRPHQAMAIYQQLAERTAAGSPLPIAGMAYVGMGEVLYEWNELPEATRCVRDGIALGEQSKNIEILLRGYVILARLRQAQGQVAEATTMARRARQIAENAAIPRMVEWTTVEQARIWVAQGDLAAAERWVQSAGIGADDDLLYLREVDYLVLAQLLLARQQASVACRLLERLLPAAEAEQRTSSVIKILVLHALALHGQGQPQQASTALERALALAAPGDYLRTFLDAGGALPDLLARIVRQKTAGSPYAARLLALLKRDQGAADATAAAGLLEPLSERELTVLHLIAMGMSNQEIATQLVVTLSTVKKHINNIYSKLDVRSRTQALARARALDLVP